MLQYVCVMGKLSKTRSVATVLQKFQQEVKAHSIVNLAEDLAEEMNRSTVYRILKRLEDNKILHSFIGKDGVRWYALTSDDSTNHAKGAHAHFQCLECGATVCLPDEVEIPDLPGHHIEKVSLLYVGSCDKCATH